MSATRVLMLGPPGAGKGTQAQRLVKSLGVPHVSTGEMLREAVAAGSEVGKRAQAIMEAGRLVDDEVVIAICKERLARKDANSGFVLDGFPRTLGQAEALDRMLAEMATPLERCVAVNADTESLIARLLKRAEIESRSDDNEETIRERMQVYEEQTAPLLRYYDEHGILVNVDGEGSIDEVAKRVEEALG